MVDCIVYISDIMRSCAVKKDGIIKVFCCDERLMSVYCVSVKERLPGRRISNAYPNMTILFGYNWISRVNIAEVRLDTYKRVLGTPIR